MSSVSIPIKEAKEPVDSGQSYLKPSTKEKREEKEKPESATTERRGKASARKEGTPRDER